MRIIISLGHPAHFHLFKNVAKNLEANGHAVKFVLTEKDILLELLHNCGFDYVVLAKRKSMESFTDKVKKIRKSTIELKNVVNEFRPDVMIGSMSQMIWVGSMKKIPTLFFGEDDFNYTYLQCLITYPFADTICTPNITKVGPFSWKKISYNGYQKLAYLHPSVFTPQKELLKGIDVEKPYFIIRLVNLNAYHDLNIKGLNIVVIKNVIKILEKYGTVYISSEYKLSSEMKRYELPIDVKNIHHAISYSSLYIGDSQSMAVEAAMLGVPSIRFNDFAGRISVLEELEHKYGLTYGIKTSDTQKMYDKIEELLSMPNLKDEFQKRRKKMLEDKINVTTYFTWFIENYPDSKRIMQENPDYQYRFK